MWRRLYALFRARNLEFVRDSSTLMWNLIFPILLVSAFAFAFSDEAQERFKVGVVGDAAALPTAFAQARYTHFISLQDQAAGVVKVERHQLDMLIAPGQQRFWVNDSSPNGYLLVQMLRANGGEAYAQAQVSGDAPRYVDWVLPGVLGMNIMFSSLFGVGYVIVRYRKNGVLKRFSATPVRPWEFLTAQVASRLWVQLGVSSLVYVGTDIFVDFHMYGSYLDLFIVFLFGCASLISLGLLVAARTASEELAGGLLNFFTWPMLFLSGVWFSLEGLHPWVQAVAQALPLTHLVAAARAIMLDGAGLGDIAVHLFVLGGMTLVALLLAARLFRWE